MIATLEERQSSRPVTHKGETDHFVPLLLLYVEPALRLLPFYSRALYFGRISQ